MDCSELTLVLQPEASLSVPLLLDRAGKPMPARDNEERIQRISEGLQHLSNCGCQVTEVSTTQLDTTLSAVHDGAYLDFLAHQSATLGADDLLIDHDFVAPGIQPDTPVIAGIHAVARESARTAIAAARKLIEGLPVVYALCRPPGHHAGFSFMGGYCYLNNSVAAAHTLLDAGIRPVGLIDIDFHFGNGSADILKSEPNVMFGSVHADTETAFPYMPVQPAHDRQLFIPFARPPTSTEFLGAVAELVEACCQCGCKAMVVSVGYDIVNGDPHGGWDLPASILHEVGVLLAQAGVPICLVQEGGYNLDTLEECAFQLGSGLLRQ